MHIDDDDNIQSHDSPKTQKRGGGARRFSSFVQHPTLCSHASIRLIFFPLPGLHRCVSQWDSDTRDCAEEETEFNPPCGIFMQFSPASLLSRSVEPELDPSHSLDATAYDFFYCRPPVGSRKNVQTLRCARHVLIRLNTRRRANGLYTPRLKNERPPSAKNGAWG